MPTVAARMGQEFTLPQAVLWSLLCKVELRSAEEWGAEQRHCTALVPKRIPLVGMV